MKFLLGFEIYIIIIVFLAGIYLLLNYLINNNKLKLIYAEIEAFCNEKGFEFKKVNSKYDLEIISNNFKMFVRLCKIPKNSSVTINSKNTWCLRFGGGQRKGRNYPNMRYLNELLPFLNTNIDNTKNEVFVVVFYPTTEVILKYINESDLREVTPSNISYGFKAIKYNEFYSSFNQLLEIKK